MHSSPRRALTTFAGVGIAALVLAGCSSSTDEGAAPEETAASDLYPMTVTDLAGNEVEIESADSIVITDNRVFGILESWGVEPTAAARTLMTPNNPWQSDESILDTGSHREPDFEVVIEADPDLIINGQRYAQHDADMQAAAPDAAFVDMTNDEMGQAEYLTESVTLLGQIFGMEDEADALIADFNAGIEEASAAYDPDMTVLGLVTTANEIRYASPEEGRGASVFFDLLDLTPALDQAGSSFDQGDDISIEALAQSQADFLLVLDRDAATAADDGSSTPAMELITESAALSTVPAVQNDAIYVMPADYYLTEDIITYTTVLEELAAAFNDAS